MVHAGSPMQRTANLGGLSAEAFLRRYWQKKPLLVRGAFPGFVDPVTPEELAGLACEDAIESRLVRGRGKRWSVAWGPQSEEIFADLPDKTWTLLVQEVNRWVPEAAALLEPFSFLPNVRVDDVMVSYAVPGGSVGAHLDSYDVFLVQGAGERRWQWHSTPTKDRRFVEGLDLRILATFEPDEDEVLGPGDMLYLPPGFAHHGVAVSPCLTYSVGFRAPSAAEAWSSFAVAAARASSDPTLLADPPLRPAENPGAIPPELLRRVRALVRSLDMSDAAIDRWYASFATRLKPGHTLTAPRRPLPEAKILAGLATRTVVRTEEGRWAFLPEPEGKGLRLYVGGSEIAVPASAAGLARTLTSRRQHPGLAPRNAAEKALIVRLFSLGALRFAAAASGR